MSSARPVVPAPIVAASSSSQCASQVGGQALTVPTLGELALGQLANANPALVVPLVHGFRRA